MRIRWTFGGQRCPLAAACLAGFSVVEAVGVALAATEHELVAHVRLGIIEPLDEVAAARARNLGQGTQVLCTGAPVLAVLACPEAVSVAQAASVVELPTDAIRLVVEPADLRVRARACLLWHGAELWFEVLVGDLDHRLPARPLALEVRGKVVLVAVAASVVEAPALAFFRVVVPALAELHAVANLLGQHADVLLSPDEAGPLAVPPGLEAVGVALAAAVVELLAPAGLRIEVPVWDGRPAGALLLGLGTHVPGHSDPGGVAHVLAELPGVEAVAVSLAARVDKVFAPPVHVVVVPLVVLGKAPTFLLGQDADLAGRESDASL
uniref:Putative secreted protein n=1 Tax=Ixodes ricinus TaxID=34613 RepID=A0A147BCG1_IXORI